MKKNINTLKKNIVISDMFCFTANLPRTIHGSTSALEYFTKNFDNATTLKGDIPIFLDTNILLSYYGMASSEKKKLIGFFHQNKSKLHLTNQVQSEYIANREKIIAKDLFGPLNNLTDDLSSTCLKITNEFSMQLNKTKRILSNDYPNVWAKLQSASEALPALLAAEGALDELKQLLNKTTKDYKDITFSDDLLRACGQLHILDPLSGDEISHLEKLFDQLNDQQKLASDTKRSFPPFPGQGDIRGKDYPYGDFIIFHEILKFMKQHDKDAVFLTNEKSKGDWMGSDRNPYTYYIELAHALTGKMLFILHAEGPLKLSMENIHGKVNFDPNTIRESPVLSIYHSKRYGFVYGRPNEEGIFFHQSSFPDVKDFDRLQNQEYLRFKIVDREGRPYIVDAFPVSYDWKVDTEIIMQGVISTLGKRYGGVAAGERTSVFNAVAVEKGDDFSAFKIGDKVEFIEGINIEGEPIIRKIRRKAMKSGETTSSQET